MKNKNLLLYLVILIGVIIPNDSYCQNKKVKTTVTPLMARKISYYCQYNDRALSLFASANSEAVQNRKDLAYKLLEKLDKHLNYAEEFIITLYSNYGIEMSYFALKDAGFTIKEIDVAELIWMKTQEKWRKEKEREERIAKEEEEKREKIAREKALVEENAILKNAIDGSYFEYNNLTTIPSFSVDVKDLAKKIDLARNNGLIDFNERVDDSFFCTISKNAVLDIPKTENPKTFNKTKSFLEDCLINNIIVQNPASITFALLDTVVIVNAKVNISLLQESRAFMTPVKFNIKWDKKNNKWKITNEKKLKKQLFKMANNEALLIYSDIENILYNSPNFKNKEKGSYSFDAYVIENEIGYLINGKEQEEKSLLSYSLKFI